MQWNSKKEARYQQMHEELNEWNRALERGENPPEPEYEWEEFLELRAWEQYRLEERVQREFGVKFGPQDAPPRVTRTLNQYAARSLDAPVDAWDPEGRRKASLSCVSGPPLGGAGKAGVCGAWAGARGMRPGAGRPGTPGWCPTAPLAGWLAGGAVPADLAERFAAGSPTC